MEIWIVSTFMNTVHMDILVQYFFVYRDIFSFLLEVKVLVHYNRPLINIWMKGQRISLQQGRLILELTNPDKELVFSLQ